jgi:glycosyltransferase involved in cell wall biosynthesis
VSRKDAARKPARTPALMSKLLAHAPSTSNDTLPQWPLVSVICPTWNRRAFLPYLVYQFQYQDYPAAQRELVILDDSPQSNAALIEQLALSDPARACIRYHHVTERMTIGAKRNRLNALAQGDVIVCMDDDDYYPPDKISHAVHAMREAQAALSGSSQIYIWYSHIDKIYLTHSFGERHALNGTLAYRRSYLKQHRYDDAAERAEESHFLNGYTAPVLQIDPTRTLLCVSHSTNTVDKHFILGNSERSALTLDDFVTDAHLRAHYRRLSHAPVSAKVEWSRFERIVIYSGQNSERLETFRAQLIEMGADAAQLVEFRAASAQGRDTASHLSVAKLARDNGWRNYLLLDDQLEFVRQEQTVENVNRLLRALGGLAWEVSLLGADVRCGVPLQSLPGSQKVQIAREAVAYAVNQPYFGAFIAHLEHALAFANSEARDKARGERIDEAWLPLMMNARWLGLYPSFAYLSQNEDGQDTTSGFFRKMAAAG